MLMRETVPRNSYSTFMVSVQNPFSSHLVSKNIEIKVYKIVRLPVVLCGHEI